MRLSSFSRFSVIFCSRLVLASRGSIKVAMVASSMSMGCDSPVVRSSHVTVSGSVLLSVSDARRVWSWFTR